MSILENINNSNTIQSINTLYILHYNILKY